MTTARTQTALAHWTLTDPEQAAAFVAQVNGDQA